MLNFDIQNRVVPAHPSTHGFILTCISASEYKSHFLPSGQVLLKYSTTKGFSFWLENCGPDLRQHAIVKATKPLYHGNR